MKVIVIFLCTLLNCDNCRRDFSLSVKCRHFGKKKKELKIQMFSFQMIHCNRHQVMEV